MDLNKFTQKSREAISEAQNIAIKYNNQQVDVEHLAYTLVSQEEGLIPSILERGNIDVSAYRDSIEREIQNLPKVMGPGAQPGQIYVTHRLNDVLVRAQDLAKKNAG